MAKQRLADVNCTPMRFEPGDRVLVCKLDRLARNLRLLVEIEAKLREKNVPLISIQEGGTKWIGNTVE